MIVKLKLENFKCFSNEVISLNSLNLLSGLNGMGKSTVIQSLLLLRQNYENGLLTLRKQLGLNGEYLNIGNSSDLLYSYFENKEISIGIEISTGQEAIWKWDASRSFDIIDQITESVNFDLAEESLFNSNFHYLNAERIGPRPYYETSTAKVIHQNQLGVRGEYAASYFVVNRDMDIPVEILKHATSTGLTLYEQVNAWLSVIRPGTKVVVKEQIDSGIVSLQFEFITGIDNPGSYKANNVGFGLTYIFPLLVAVLSSKPGTLLLLENPEAHIHPRGQAELGVFLALAASAGVQIILETHSDHILNGIRYAVKQTPSLSEKTNLMFFSGDLVNDRYVHRIEYIGLNEQGKLLSRPKDFFDVWDDLLIKLI